MMSHWKAIPLLFGLMMVALKFIALQIAILTLDSCSCLGCMCILDACIHAVSHEAFVVTLDVWFFFGAWCT